MPTEAQDLLVISLEGMQKTVAEMERELRKRAAAQRDEDLAAVEGTKNKLRKLGKELREKEILTERCLTARRRAAAQDRVKQEELLKFEAQFQKLREMRNRIEEHTKRSRKSTQEAPASPTRRSMAPGEWEGAPVRPQTARGPRRGGGGEGAGDRPASTGGVEGMRQQLQTAPLEYDTSPLDIELEIQREKQREAIELAAELRELNQIMEDFNFLLKEQAPGLTEIRQNVRKANDHVEAGREEIRKARSHQRTCAIM